MSIEPMKALPECQIRTLTERVRLTLNEDAKKLGCSMPKMFVNAAMSNSINIMIRNGNRDMDDSMNMKKERGVRFVVGDSFFREESRTGRDLGVLAAALHKRRFGKLRVLDAMCGCGVRALRYLVEANADFVWANDANDHTRPTILSNLSQIRQQDDYQDHENNNTGRRKWVISHCDANRVMVERYLQGDYYDLIDVDSFGSDSFFLGSALSAMQYGGLLYLTSTDGVSSGGHRPHNALASYGAFIRPMPYANEIGLRMLIGGAVREAATRDMDVWPVFSYFARHGPVFRVMLRVRHGKPKENKHYGFISYCSLCGDSRAFSWDEMGEICCPCPKQKVSRSLVVSGPLWTGPLHSGSEIEDMLGLAEEWGWTTKEKCSSGGNNTSLQELLNIMLEESIPELPFGFIKLDEIASRGKMSTPRREKIIDLLKKEGYAASRSHIASDVVKTNCSMVNCIKLVSMYSNLSILKTRVP